MRLPTLNVYNPQSYYGAEQQGEANAMRDNRRNALSMAQAGLQDGSMDLQGASNFLMPHAPGVANNYAQQSHQNSMMGLKRDRLKFDAAQADRTPLTKNYDRTLKDPNFYNYQLGLKSAGRPTTNVNIGGDAGEKAYGTKMGGYDATNHQAYLSAGPRAQGNLSELDYAERKMEEGIGSGPLTEAILPLKAFAVDMGWMTEDEARKVGATETFQAITKKFILAPIQETKGAISDKEMSTFERMAPGIGKTMAGNRMLMQWKREIYQRQLKASEIFREAYYANSPDGSTTQADGHRAEMAVKQWQAENPFFTRERREAAADMIRNGAGTARGAGNADRKGDARAVRPSVTGKGYGPNGDMTAYEFTQAERTR